MTIRDLVSAMLPSGDEGLFYTMPAHGHPEQFSPSIKKRYPHGRDKGGAQTPGVPYRRLPSGKGTPPSLKTAKGRKSGRTIAGESGGQTENSSLTARNWLVVDGAGRIVGRYGTYKQAFWHANARTDLRVRLDDDAGMHRSAGEAFETRFKQNADERARQLGLRRRYEKKGILVRRRSVGYPNPTASNVVHIGGR